MAVVGPSHIINRNSYAMVILSKIQFKRSPGKILPGFSYVFATYSQSYDDVPKGFDSPGAIPKNGIMRSIIPILAITAVLSLAACSLLFPDRTAPKSASYHVDKLQDPWQKVAVADADADSDALRADLAFENKKNGGIISINSICRKYNRYSLEELTLNLVRGIESKEEISQTKRQMDGAEALDSLFSGIVDGVKVNIRTVVLTKNNCTYDFLHIIVPQKNQTADPEFDRFIASFRTE